MKTKNTPPPPTATESTPEVQPAATPAAATASDKTPPPVAKPEPRSAAGSPKPPKAAKTATKAPRAAVARPKAKGAKRSGMSGLDAAAKVLAEAGKPMRCADVVERVLAKGLWKTSGKTPAATIHAAVIREIKVKGKQSRFKKAGRGLFSAKA